MLVIPAGEDELEVSLYPLLTTEGEEGLLGTLLAAAATAAAAEVMTTGEGEDEGEAADADDKGEVDIGGYLRIILLS